jgi:hypothetical protein
MRHLNHAALDEDDDFVAHSLRDKLRSEFAFRKLDFNRNPAKYIAYILLPVVLTAAVLIN